MLLRLTKCRFIIIIISAEQLFWTKKPRSAVPSQSTSLTPLREFRQLVPGDQHVFRIPDLEPDTTYFVQVTLASRFCVVGVAG